MGVKEEILHILAKVYKEQASWVLDELLKLELDLNKENFLQNSKGFEWYKDIRLYAVYPNSIIYDTQSSPLQNLKLHLTKVKDLGFNAIHILPFFASPMRDNGFDVSDYLSIRPELGTLEDFKELLLGAKQLDLIIFIDLIFNHVSNQHIWFKNAQLGNEYYRNYFIHTNKRPQFINKYYSKSAIWATYKVDEELVRINIAFPEHCGELPHWFKGQDGYWYYHTYYPSQLDLNWFNPHVFMEIVKAIVYWAKLGVNFRLDAIPFVGQGAYKKTDISNPIAHAIIFLLKIIALSYNPTCLFLSEAYETPKKTVSYFGSDKFPQADLAYDFNLCTAVWVSIVKQDISYIFKSLKAYGNIPKHACWINFLRNHDELSLAYLKASVLQEMQAKLSKFGKFFREGCGISGRTFSLLNTNLNKFLTAYFLLASLPGGLLLTYWELDKSF